MYVTTPDNTNFSSRNATIRHADNIARHVNKIFPRISATLVGDFAHAGEYKNLVESLDMEICLTRALKDSFFDEAGDFFDVIDSAIESINTTKRGNCGESAELAAITAKVNGIKKAHLAKLFMHNYKETKDLDHEVLVVEGVKPYIIDAWLGFADYIPETFLRFKRDFSQHFDFLKNGKLFFKNANGEFSKILNMDFDDNLINEILKHYPEIKMPEIVK